jgi:hypothetical protein
MELPQFHRQGFAELQQALEQLHRQLLAPADPELDIRAAIAQLQTIFQEKIIPLPLDELPAPVEHQVQSFQVEINKQLRLLGMDGMFLQAARQPATTDQRRNQIHDRLVLLHRYCEAVLRGEGEEGMEG